MGTSKTIRGIIFDFVCIVFMVIICFALIVTIYGSIKRNSTIKNAENYCIVELEEKCPCVCNCNGEDKIINTTNVKEIIIKETIIKEVDDDDKNVIKINYHPNIHNKVDNKVNNHDKGKKK